MNWLLALSPNRLWLLGAAALAVFSFGNATGATGYSRLVAQPKLSSARLELATANAQLDKLKLDLLDAQHQYDEALLRWHKQNSMLAEQIRNSQNSTSTALATVVEDINNDPTEELNRPIGFNRALRLCLLASQARGDRSPTESCNAAAGLGS